MSRDSVLVAFCILRGTAARTIGFPSVAGGVDARLDILSDFDAENAGTVTSRALSGSRAVRQRGALTLIK